MITRFVFNTARGDRNGVVYANATLGLERKAARAKQLELPTRSQFAAFVKETRSAGGRDSQNCADLVEGLAYTGRRLGEAGQIAWKDLNFEADEILVNGDPEEATKNGEVRRVPLIPKAKALFQRMRAERSDESRTENVYRVKACPEAMDNAAKKVGMARISIESGVDIPIVN